jgi:hypothetical protein
MKRMMAALMVTATLACGAAQAKDNTAALLGGVAAGALGGVVLGNVLRNQAPPPPPAPVYVRPAPTVEVVEPVRPVVRTVVASPYDDQAYDLKEACDSGSKRACIRFGIMIGKHQERVATWRRTHPDFFSYED